MGDQLSTWATLLRVSQSHFEAPSGPFLEGSKAGPIHLRSKGNDYFIHFQRRSYAKSWTIEFYGHLRSQAVSLTGTMVGLPVEKVSVPYNMNESQSKGVSENRANKGPLLRITATKVIASRTLFIGIFIMVLDVFSQDSKIPGKDIFKMDIEGKAHRSRSGRFCSCIIPNTWNSS